MERREICLKINRESETRVRKNVSYENVTRISLIIVIMLAPSLYFGYINNLTAMGLAIVASSITICFLNLDKIARFKGAGFEAEIRQVENVVKKAYATIDQLKNIGKMLIISTGYQIQYHDRLGNISEDKELMILREMIDVSTSLSSDANEHIILTLKIRESLKINDALRPFTELLWAEMSSDALEREKYEAIIQEFNGCFEKFQYPSIDQISKMLSSSYSIVITEQQKKLLEEYDEYRNINPYRNLLNKVK